jgi:hypothetical protein
MFSSLQSTSWYSVWYTVLIYAALSAWFFIEIKLIMNSKKIHPPHGRNFQPVSL